MAEHPPDDDDVDKDEDEDDIISRCAEAALALSLGGRAEEAVEALAPLSSALLAERGAGGLRDKLIGSSGDHVCVKVLFNVFPRLDAALSANLPLKLRLWKHYLPCLKACAPPRPIGSSHSANVLLRSLIGNVQELISPVALEAVSVASSAQQGGSSNTPHLVDILAFFAQRLCATLLYLRGFINDADTFEGIAAICEVRGCLHDLEFVRGAEQAVRRATPSLDQAVLRLFSPDVIEGATSSFLDTQQPTGAMFALPIDLLFAKRPGTNDRRTRVGTLLFVHFLIQHILFDDENLVVHRSRPPRWTPVYVLPWLVRCIAEVASPRRGGSLLPCAMTDALLVSVCTRTLVATSRCSRRTREISWTELIVLVLSSGPAGIQLKASVVQGWSLLLLRCASLLVARDAFFICALVNAVRSNSSSVSLPTSLWCSSALQLLLSGGREFQGHECRMSLDFCKGGVSPSIAILTLERLHAIVNSRGRKLQQETFAALFSASCARLIKAHSAILYGCECGTIEFVRAAARALWLVALLHKHQAPSSSSSSSSSSSPRVAPRPSSASTASACHSPQIISPAQPYDTLSDTVSILGVLCQKCQEMVEREGIASQCELPLSIVILADKCQVAFIQMFTGANRRGGGAPSRNDADMRAASLALVEASVHLLTLAECSVSSEVECLLISVCVCLRRCAHKLQK